MNAQPQTPTQTNQHPKQGEKSAETLNLTPTWEEQLTVCLTIFENAKSEAARMLAMGEMRKMARIADYYCGLVKANRLENNFKG